MLVKVKTLTGKEIELNIEPSDPISRLKERVEELEGIPPSQQRLIYSGKQMQVYGKEICFNQPGMMTRPPIFTNWSLVHSCILCLLCEAAIMDSK